MNKFFQAAEDIKKEGKRLKGMVEFADELEKLGSLEQVAKELEAKHLRIKSAVDETEKHLKDLSVICQKKEDEAKKCDADAKAKSDGMIKLAQSQSHEISMKAEKDANDMRMRAKREYDAMNLDMDTKQIEIDMLDSKILAATEKLKSIQDQMSAVKKLVGA